MKITNCILVNLSIGYWDANSLDRVVSRAVADANGVTDPRMCRLRKSLLPKTAVMNQLISSVRAARTYHYENTHAWVHEGPRILTRGNYDTYMRDMAGLKSAFETSVLDFVSQYDAIKQTANEVLGALFKEEDYPSQALLAARYKFEIGRQPMPVASTLAEFGLDPEEAKGLQAQLERDLSETFSQANKKMWDDLYGKLEKLSNKLNEDNAYVMEETIAGVVKLSELVPRNNLTSDAKLEVVAKHLVNTLEGVTANGVKVNPAMRARVAKEARQAVLAMQAMMRPEDAAAVAPLNAAVKREAPSPSV
jgi:hypothetical protein